MHIFTTDGVVSHTRATASSSGAVRVRCLAQGILDTLGFPEQEPGIKLETFRLPANLLYLLSHRQVWWYVCVTFSRYRPYRTRSVCYLLQTRCVCYLLHTRCVLAWLTPGLISIYIEKRSGNHTFIFSYLRRGLRLPRAVIGPYECLSYESVRGSKPII